MHVPRDLPAAAVGAAVTVLAMQVPLAPLFGGVVAAGVRRDPQDEGVRVGAMTGVLAVVGLVLLGNTPAAAVDLLQTRGAVDSVHVGLLGLIAVLYLVVLGGLGGFLGANARRYLRRRVASFR